MSSVFSLHFFIHQASGVNKSINLSEKYLLVMQLCLPVYNLIM